MTLLVASLPLVVALTLALTRSALWGGLAGAGLAIAAGLWYAPLSLPAAAWTNLLGRALVGTLIVGYIIYFGLLLYEVLVRGGAVQQLVALLAAGVPTPGRQGLGVALALGSAIEAISGFGAGTLVVAPLLLGLGFTPVRAALLSLFSQSLVPWGALAVGSLLGAQLATMPARDLSLATASLQAPLLIWYALLASWLAGGGPRGLPRALATGAAMAGAVWAASWLGWVELAGLAGGLAGLAVALIGPRSRNAYPQPAGAPSTVRALAPYGALTLALILTRLPTFAPPLSNFAVIASPDQSVRLPPVYSPGFWLFVSSMVAVVTLRVPLPALPGLAARSARRWWPATLALLAYLVMAEVMRAGGATATLARGLGAALGHAYLAAAPLVGALGGLLTGSNAGANASLMELQLTSARAAGVAPAVAAALQNAGAANATLASPARTLLAATAAGVLSEATPLFRRALAIELVALVLLVGQALVR